jgi:hypothetical protein
MTDLSAFMQEMMEQAEQASSSDQSWRYQVMPATVQPGWVAKLTGERPVFFSLLGEGETTAQADAIAYIEEHGDEPRPKGKRYSDGLYPNLVPGVQVSYWVRQSLSGPIEAGEEVWHDTHFLLFSERRWDSEEDRWEYGAWNWKIAGQMWAETEHGGPVFAEEDYGKAFWCVVRQETDRTYNWEDDEKNNDWNTRTYTDSDGVEKRSPRLFRVIVEKYDDVELAKARAQELGIEVSNTDLALPDAGTVSSSSVSIPAPDGYDEDVLGSWGEMLDYLVGELTSVSSSPPPVRNKKIKSLRDSLEDLGLEIDLVDYVLEHLG